MSDYLAQSYDKALAEIERLRNELQDKNGVIDRLKHERDSAELMSLALQANLDALRSALDRLYRWSCAMLGCRVVYTGDHPIVVAERILAAPKPGDSA